MGDGNYFLTDSVNLINPRWIRYHPDSFLVLQELGTDKMIKIIDLKTKKVQEIIQKGRGPNEMINAWGISIIGKDIWVFGGQIKKFIKLSHDETRKFHISDEVMLEDKKCLNGLALNDSVFVGLDLPSKKRLSLYNKEGKRTKVFGEFPPIENSGKIEADNNIFTSKIAGNSKTNTVVVACSDVDILEVYDITKNSFKRIHGPEGIKIRAKKVDVGMGTMIRTEPRFLAYGDIITHDQGFFVGYTGFKPIKNGRRALEESFPRNVFSFSWDGIPKTKYVFNNPLFSFDLDKDNKKLYAITMTPEPKITMFDLNGKL
ncbi:MAG: BF3164 family lipoprotein [Lachnospirales bacterium]